MSWWIGIPHARSYDISHECSTPSHDGFGGSLGRGISGFYTRNIEESLVNLFNCRAAFIARSISLLLLVSLQLFPNKASFDSIWQDVKPSRSHLDRFVRSSMSARQMCRLNQEEILGDTGAGEITNHPPRAYRRIALGAGSCQT